MIAISSGWLSALTANNLHNNPVVAWDNKALGATLTTTTGTEVQTAAYAGTASTYDAWIVTPSSGAAVLHIDLGAAEAASFVGLARHNLATVGATVSAQHSADNATWVDCAGNVTPEDNQAIGFRFEPVTRRYWRLTISGATDDVTLAVAFVGHSVIVPVRVYGGYDPVLSPNVVEATSNRTEGGEYISTSVVRRGSNGGVGFQHIEPWFLRGDESHFVPTDSTVLADTDLWTDGTNTFKPFIPHFNEGNPFFWAWRPAKYGDLFYAAQSGGPMKLSNMGVLDLMSVNMGMWFHDNP